jgi:hypothetical protein
VFCCSVSVCRPSTVKGREAGRPVEVAFRRNHARPPAKRTGEGDRAKQAEGSEAEKRPENGKGYCVSHIRASGRNWRESWQPPHDSCQASIFRPVSDNSRGGMQRNENASQRKGIAGGAAMERSGNGGNWRSQASFPAAVCDFASVGSRSSKGRSLPLLRL